MNDYADAVCKIVRRAGREAGIEFSIHPHMLRHATGYKLANDGQDTRAIQHYLGHRNIQHTTRYTDLASDRFKDFGVTEHRLFRFRLVTKFSGICGV